MYNLNYHNLSSEILLTATTTTGSSDLNNTNVDVVPCKSGWIYDTTSYKNTVVTEVVTKTRFRGLK